MCAQKTVAATSLYNILKSYAENLQAGPQFSDPLPEPLHLPKNQWIDLMGYQAASPLGVPAGPLLNSQWIELAAKLGFDILTYKTIRSQSHPGHPLPNVIFVKESLSGSDRVEGIPEPLEDTPLSITNSFGMPSMSPDYLQRDIAKAKNCLSTGQILIVSVVGTPGISKTIEEDFVRAALLAKEAGADIIEANFSCPNISSKEGSLYTDPENCTKIASFIAREIAPLPLMIKVGHYTDPDLLKKVLIALSRAGVRGVAGINSVSKRVINHHQAPALGQGREIGGICGEMIRPHALTFIQQAKAVIDKEKLDLTLVGCGGIMEPEHFDLFLQSGAHATLTATAMLWDPYIALKWKQKAVYAAQEAKKYENR